ncbi:ABC transporter permease [candidate division KSB1 bacterium]|nr:ABC transporter permease [candidate division KSB1 bacterium]
MKTEITQRITSALKALIFSDNILLYFFKRLIGVIIVLLIICYLSFILIHAAPGNFLEISRLQSYLTAGDMTSQERITSQWEERFGTNKPIYEQYARFINDTIKLEFGPSFRYPNTNIEDMIKQAFPVSFTLALWAIILALIIGSPLGVLSALYPNTWIDRLCMFFAMLGQCIPIYVIAVGLQLIIAVQLKLLPTSGWGRWENYIMPVIGLGVMPIAATARYMRSSMLHTLQQSYIRTAYAKGGTPSKVVGNHALRNSVIPLITVLGPQVGAMLVGSVFIETTFRVPGLGQFFAQSALNRDYPLMIASLMFLAATISIMNLLVDISYRIIDPRMKKQ